MELFVLIHHRRLALHRDTDWRYFRLELTASIGIRGTLVRLDGVVVLLFACHFEFDCRLFRARAHVDIVLGVPQTVLDDSINQRLIAVAGTLTL